MPDAELPARQTADASFSGRGAEMVIMQPSAGDPDAGTYDFKVTRGRRDSGGRMRLVPRGRG